MSDRFDAAGYGGQGIGFGARPAVLTVDFQHSFTRDKWPIGGSPHIQDAVRNTTKLLQQARQRALPVASCNCAWGSAQEMSYWKIPPLYDGHCFHGQEATQIEDCLVDKDYDFLFTKSAPSIFFLTPLLTFLIRQCVDTVIITGCTTSGCVRASIVDAFSYGFRVIVPEDCVGDQELDAHEANLRDVSRRYADVMPLAAVLEHLEANFPVTSPATAAG